MPTTPTNTYTFDPLQPSRAPELARMEGWQMKVSTTLTKGTVVGIVAATGKIAAYLDTNVDGTQTARGILPLAATTDANGNITVGGGNVLGQTQDSIAVFVGGYFRSQDVTGLDAAGLADLGGHIVWGDLTTGEICIPV